MTRRRVPRAASAGSILSSRLMVRGVAGVADSGGGERHQVLAAQLARGPPRVGHRADQVLGTPLGQRAGLVDPLGQAQHGALGAGRCRVRAAMRIHDEQVDGVGSDV